MKKITNSEGLKTQKALVLGKRTVKVRELERILAQYFYNVCLITDLPNCVKLSLNNNFHIIIVTDSIGVKLDNRLFSNLRTLFPNAKLLCLGDQINQETEKAMRSAGLIFLGSYDHFNNNCQDILKSALKPNYAVNLEVTVPQKMEQKSENFQ